MVTPEQIVRDFIQAYADWNDRANDRARLTWGNASDEQMAMVAAGAEYDELLARFCAPSVVRQGISYGDESMHHPDRETVESVVASAQEALVRTRHVGLYGFVSDYTYRLVREADEWRIASLLYTTEDGQYECL